jgi:hypothetical protein
MGSRLILSELESALLLRLLVAEVDVSVGSMGRYLGLPLRLWVGRGTDDEGLREREGTWYVGSVGSSPSFSPEEDREVAVGVLVSSDSDPAEELSSALTRCVASSNTGSSLPIETEEAVGGAAADPSRRWSLDWCLSPSPGTSEADATMSKLILSVRCLPSPPCVELSPCASRLATPIWLAAWGRSSASLVRSSCSDRALRSPILTSAESGSSMKIRPLLPTVISPTLFPRPPDQSGLPGVADSSDSIGDGTASVFAAGAVVVAFPVVVAVATAVAATVWLAS